MSTRITDSETAALYDSVTGTAFGPVFEGSNARELAEDFLQWLNSDPRAIEPAMLESIHMDWWEERGKDLGDLDA